MVSMQDNVITSESRLTFMEASSIIVGHGVGSGILAVSFLASRNRWQDFLWIVLAAYLINLVLLPNLPKHGIFNLPETQNYFDSIWSSLYEKKFSHRVLMKYEEPCSGNMVK